ncbi:hypothetical protein CRENBAI_014105 [Crenichthys baileyi]|uniref:Uncharacterized protein n=1 Tax=Crenichthys baileyi TaxID=28760 RepID=A0AAV9RKD8_9TELE
MFNGYQVQKRCRLPYLNEEIKLVLLTGCYCLLQILSAVLHEACKDCCCIIINDPVTDFPSVPFCFCFSGLIHFNFCRHYSQQQVCHRSLCPDEIISSLCLFPQGTSECIIAQAEG